MDMSETNAPTSLLSSCISCKASCCKGKKVTVTDIGYQKIIDAGHPDHFHKTDIAEGTFYVLDHSFAADGSFTKSGACPYLQDNQCTIENEKPDTCAAYPMVRKIDYTGWVKEYGITTACPAAEIAANLPAFKENTRVLIEKINNDMPPRLSEKILCQHNDNLREKFRANKDTELKAKAEKNAAAQWTSVLPTRQQNP